MREAKGNLWDFQRIISDIICITTNGTVKKNGECVMGAGCALEAKQRHPDIAKLLGESIKERGNIVVVSAQFRIASFPVKHNWWEKADVNLIRESAITLKGMAERLADHTFYLPRPGCGNGKLDWEIEVKPLLESLDLPDNIVIVSFPVTPTHNNTKDLPRVLTGVIETE